METSSPSTPTQAAPPPLSQLFWQSVAGWAISKHQALHNPGELTTLLSVLNGMRPTTAVEIGTWAGGLCYALDQLPSVQRIITVDIEEQRGAAPLLAALHCRASQVIGDSTQPSTQAAVDEQLAGVKADVVVIDGGHDYRTARLDFTWAGTLARPGGLIVLHDTQGHPGPVIMDVPRLWAEIRASYRTTELIDLPGGPGGTGLVWL